MDGHFFQSVIHPELVPYQTVALKALASSRRAPPKQLQDTNGCDFIPTTQRALVIYDVI